MEHPHNPPTNKPSLVVVHQGFDLPGGVSTSCLNQINILLKRYQITLITDRGRETRDDYPEALNVVRLRAPQFVWLHRIGHIPRQWVFIQMVKRHLHHSQGIHEIAAVIFHSHPAAALLANFLRKLGVRSILVVHGDIFERPAGTYGRQLTTWYRWATPRAYRRVDAIFSLSPAMQELAKRWANGITKIYLVPNSIDPSEVGIYQATRSHETTSASPQSFPPHTIELRHNALLCNQIEPITSIPDLLYVGRIEPIKGVDNLLRAVAQLHHQGRPATLLCVGSIKSSYEQELRTQMKQLQIETAVQFSPPVPRSKLGNLYQNCLILVVPSLSEPQATVILEGMAAGCAIVASKTGGNEMMLDHGISGLLFPSDDVAALTRCLGQLLDNSSAREELGAAAMQRFATKFSREAVAPQLLEAVAASLR
ncbi:MAG: glycosyltransferase family 4 protein [Synechococcaceae cyanobacterium]